MKFKTFFLIFLLACHSVFAAVTFDGTNTKLESTSSSANMNGLTTITVSAWVRPTGLGEGPGLSAMVTKGPDTVRWRLKFEDEEAATNNRIAFLAGWTTLGNWQSTSDNTMTKNVWQHVLATYSFSSTANVPSLYVNGTQIAAISAVTSPSGSATADNSNFQIGNNNAQTRTFAGDIEEVAVWNVILTDAEILQLASSRTKRLPLQIRPSALVGYWPLDECGDGVSCGNRFKDLSSNATDLTASSATGKGGQSLSYA